MMQERTVHRQKTVPCFIDGANYFTRLIVSPWICILLFVHCPRGLRPRAILRLLVVRDLSSLLLSSYFPRDTEIGTRTSPPAPTVATI